MPRAILIPGGEARQSTGGVGWAARTPAATVGGRCELALPTATLAPVSVASAAHPVQSALSSAERVASNLPVAKT
jgi:hypothetical protein